MKFSLQTILPIAMFCLFSSRILADDDENMRLIAIRTLLLAPDSTPIAVLEAIDAGMDSISDEDSRRGRKTQEVGQLRSIVNQRELRQCNSCYWLPPEYKGCWINWRYVQRCRKRPSPPAPRNLVVHQKLSNDAVENLGDNERRRYLQLAQQCEDERDDMEDLIATSTAAGIIPVLPAGASFIEECIFEEIDDDEDEDDEDKDD